MSEQYICPAPTAPEGKVQHLAEYTAQQFLPGSAILCRNNAPLIAFAYALLNKDVPCRILGRDIGKQLSDLVKKMHATTLDDFMDRLKAWHDREVERAIRDDRSPERITDQFECLTYFVRSLDESARSVPDLLAKIELMFTDDGNSAGRVTLSSIHKAKGLEYDVVFLLDQQKTCPSRYARKAGALQQEYNLLYVAVTRAKHELYYINSESWKN